MEIEAPAKINWSTTLQLFVQVLFHYWLLWQQSCSLKFGPKNYRRHIYNLEVSYYARNI